MDAGTARPERLGQYEVVETLALGPIWRTYKGFDPMLRQSVALKTVAKHDLDRYGAGVISRIQNEARAAAGLNHPGIVRVYGYDEDSDLAFIATEYVDGQSLKERFRIPVADAVALGMQLLEALDYAHGQGVIHRAIKPSNLLLTAKGQLRISDFGVARIGAGAPEYLSPEQLIGAAVDRRSDLFSAGIVFYEWLTGASPFPWPSHDLINRVYNDKERPPSQVNPDIPRGFDSVCALALARAVNDRYPTAQAFCDGVGKAFGAAFGSPPSRAVSHGTVLAAGSPRAEAQSAAGPEPEAKTGSMLPASRAGAKWKDETLRDVEKQLAAFVGPLARVFVQKAASKATNLDQIYLLAAQSLERPEERQAFLAGKADLIGGGTPSQPPEMPAPVPRSVAPASAAPVEFTHEPKAAARTDVSSSGRPAAGPELKPGVQPEAKPSTKPEAKPETKPSPAPELKLEAKPSPKPEATLEAKPRPKPEEKTEAKPGPKVEPKPESKAPLKPHAAPTPPAPDVAARLEEMLGKQPESLAGYMEDGPQQVERVIHPFVATVEALAAVYAANSKIEPLNPQNIDFDRMGKATIRGSRPVTHGTGGVVSNPRYAAPEVFAEKGIGAESTASAADVYALGIMFYEIVLGRTLFAKAFADEQTDLDWLSWHADLEKKAPSLKSLLPDCPAALSDVLESMMEKHPEKRATDLENILSRLRSVAQRANKTIVLPKPAAKGTAPMKPPVAAANAKRSAAALSVPWKKADKRLALVLFLLLALIAGGILVWENPDLYRELITRFHHLAQTL